MKSDFSWLDGVIVGIIIKSEKTTQIRIKYFPWLFYLQEIIDYFFPQDKKKSCVNNKIKFYTNQ